MKTLFSRLLVVCTCVCAMVCCVMFVCAMPFCAIALGQVAGPTPEQGAASNHIRLQSAFIVPRKQVVVSARESGTLVQFHLQPGDSVKTGQLIAALDSTETRLLVARAKVDLEMAQQSADSQLEINTAQQLLEEARQLQKQAELSRNIAKLISTSDISQQSAAVQLSSASAELDRATRSRAKHASSISQTEIDRLQLAFSNATIEVQKAKQDKAITALRLQLEESGLSEKQQAVKRQQLAVAQAQNKHTLTGLAKAQREIALKLAEDMHQRREFTSPIDGVVAETFFVDGEWVKLGDKIARVVNLERLYAEGFVDAQYTRAELKQARATIVIRHKASQIEIPAEVVFVSPEVDRRNRQFQVRVEFDNRKFGISPGTPAEVSIELPR